MSYSRKLHKQALEGGISESDMSHLIREGQSGHDLPLVIDDRGKTDMVVTVIKDRSESSAVEDFRELSQIVKGKCEHCGCNRLKEFSKSPEGVHGYACPVCNRDTMNSYEFRFSLERDNSE